MNIDPYVRDLRAPRVGAKQAMAVAVAVPYATDAILIWGRDAQSLGPSAEGSGDADCLFGAFPYTDPVFGIPPFEPDEPLPTEPDDPPPTERDDPTPAGCGCRDGSPTLGLVPLLLLGARRRSGRVLSRSGQCTGLGDP